MTTPYSLPETVAVNAPDHEKMHAESHRRLNAGIRYTLLWNGSAYVDANGVVATASNRQLKSYREFIGPSDPNALGLMIDGDSWRDTTP